MEENKEISATPAQEQAEAVSLEAVDEAVVEETSLPEQNDAAHTEESEATVVALPTTQEKPKRERRGTFLAVFGVVVGVCALILCTLLFLGKDGFDIVRTLRSERTIFVRDGVPEDGMLTPSEAAYAAKQYTVSISVVTEDALVTGSGFVYDANGHIVTNYHVVEEAKTIQVLLPDGTARDATLVGFDEMSDLAVLQIDATGLTVATLGKSETLLVGEDVVAVGAPVALDYAGTASFGKITATSRLLSFRDASTGGVTHKWTLIQTDTALNKGNSGGPLVDMYGNVIGVVVSKIFTYGGVDCEGMSFALPIDSVRTVLDAIIKDGVFTGNNPIAEGPSMLGVRGYTVKEGMWYCLGEGDSVLNSPTQKEGYHKAAADGVYVYAVEGEQASGKLFAGDVILRVNGLHMSTILDVIEAVNRYHVGETITVTVLRDGNQIETQIRLAEGTIS